ncbi:MAG: phosphate ABC transporter substrate-binding protein [Vicinamibacteria bacterium]|nr:phosphate ABC transporter substrate-binding protein [Vicinamibacteria bacterium]
MGIRQLRFAAWALLAWCALWPGLVSAQGVDRSLRVVVNKENKLASLTTDDLTRIFLGKKTLWDSGTRIVPVMPEEESAPGELFLSGTLKKSVSQFRAYWKRLLFSGGGAVPKVFRNHDQLLDFVARQPGAIGVVEASAVDDRVKVLDISN